MDSPQLTEEEISDIVCRYPEDTDFVSYSVQDAADAQLRKALTWAYVFLNTDFDWHRLNSTIEMREYMDKMGIELWRFNG